MTHVFVHGNPETDFIWLPLLDELTARSIVDFVLLSPPGFGSPTPDDWSATMAEYSGWLRAELDQLDGPIDLVGHDWGAGHVFGLLASPPASVRSWAADCAVGASAASSPATPSVPASGRSPRYSRARSSRE